MHFLPDLGVLYALGRAPNFYEIHPWAGLGTEQQNIYSSDPNTGNQMPFKIGTIPCPDCFWTIPN
jgi:hypothetical protein